jgi:hypothetical protein
MYNLMEIAQSDGKSSFHTHNDGKSSIGRKKSSFGRKNPHSDGKIKNVQGRLWPIFDSIFFSKTFLPYLCKDLLKKDAFPKLFV